ADLTLCSDATTYLLTHIASREIVQFIFVNGSPDPIKVLIAESLPVVGRGFVLDSIMDTAEHKTLALLEWRNPLVRERIPQSVSGPGENVVHVIFPERCTTSPTEEIPGDTASPSTTEVEVSLPSNAIGPEVLNALGSLVEKCLKPTQPFTGFGYRKLRFFSGKQPTPQGEEDFESWMDQASQAVEEWDIPETQKKQRIAESLKGLAADTIRNLKMSKFDCTAKDYLEVLHDVFGRTEKASDLLYQFEHTYQEVGEKLSDYINRLDKILHQIILKKGVDPKVADQVRIETEASLDLTFQMLLAGKGGKYPLWPLSTHLSQLAKAENQLSKSLGIETHQESLQKNPVLKQKL
uniref:Paraneoplastic antigen Ma-like C-terminal domain-containing protein n=1 Tax=Xenopus tropicalis TaxID=8364 RepID=A0A803J9Y4_XENTR